MSTAKRPPLPSVRSPVAEPAANDELIKNRLREATKDVLPDLQASAAARSPARPAERSMQFVMPDYLFEELGHKAVGRRVTKRYLLLEALVQAGYRVDEADMVEDGRRRR
jgi:hypothetical protein